MTWYYVPYTCAPDTAASSLPSEASPAPWLTLSGTPTQRPLSWRGWRNRGWIGLLSGLTCAPSTLARGVAEWISSLPVFLASPSAPPASAPELTMTVGSGQTSAGSSVTFDPDTCSWRTSQVLFATDFPMSSLTLPASGSMRNGVCSPRPPLVPLTSVNGSGSWPTPRGQDGTSGATAHSREDFRPTLKQSVAMWGTPVARDDQKSPEAHMAMKARMDRNTPTSLTVQAKMWPTPRASEGFRGTDPPHGTGGPSLRQVATGTASRHAPTTPTDGPNGSAPADLNPLFVEALMGLQSGWLTASISAATDSCPSAPAPRGTNSSNDWGRREA